MTMQLRGRSLWPLWTADVAPGRAGPDGCQVDGPPGFRKRPDGRTLAVLVGARLAGNTRGASAAYGGISEDALGAWLRNYADFAEAVKSAEAQAEVAHVANITRAAQNGAWTASAW